MRLTDAIEIGSVTVRNRLVFGPHVTNLGWDRGFTDRHTAYYRRRAAGGAGMIVTESASVHPGDWPYERAPLAGRSAAGWAAIAAALHAEGALAIAGLQHTGGQGTSAYSQAALWGASAVPQNSDREVPKVMEPDDIDAVIEGFGASAATAVSSGMDGVEVSAGQFSLLRQFLSGLTNFRGDAYGEDKGLLLAEVLAAVRTATAGGIVGLRLSCDEMAPWAGITPEAGAELAARFAEQVDYLVVERGSIYTAWATRPDGHIEPGFNLDTTRMVAGAIGEAAVVIAQGSIVDVAMAESAIADGVCGAVEMTRAQIADPDLGMKAAAGDLDRIRPCVLCNQRCMVKDARNPIVSCLVEPGAGHETEDADLAGNAPEPRDILVVGAGPAGLEAARVAARRGHQVTVRALAGPEESPAVAAVLPGMSRLPGFVDWQRRECVDAGVRFDFGRPVTASELENTDAAVVLCTGGRPAPHGLDVADGAAVMDGFGVVRALATDRALPGGPVVIWDPLGAALGVGLAELLASERAVTLITPDLIVAKDLALTGDLAPANTRLQAAGVDLITVSEVSRVEPDRVIVEHRYTGEPSTIEASWVVAAVHREPELTLWEETGKRFLRVGDAVAPRTVYESVLEARRAVLAIEAGS